MNSKQAELLVLEKFNRISNSKFKWMNKNKFSGFDIAGVLRGKSIVIEVKGRKGVFNWGDKTGWILEESKVKSINDELIRHGKDPKEVIKYYVCVWKGELFIFDIDLEIQGKLQQKVMNGTTEVEGARQEVKESKGVYLLMNSTRLRKINN